MVKVDKQDFFILQVFQGSGIGKMEDNSSSANPLSYMCTFLSVEQDGEWMLVLFPPTYPEKKNHSIIFFCMK